MSPPIETSFLTPETLFASPCAWNDLIARSDANPLFMGWAWQSAWWDTWRAAFDLEPRLLAAHRGDRLVGLAPLVRVRSGTPLLRHQLHVIGNLWQIGDTTRSEHIDFICDRTDAEQTAAALFAAIRRERDWSVLTIRDLSPSRSPACLETISGMPLLEREAEPGVRIDTSGDFESWLKMLGRNTRLKLFNRRRWIEQHLGPISESVEEDPAAALSALNQLHVERWGRPCFSADHLAFHERVLARLPPALRAECSTIRVGDRVVSRLYDIRTSSVTYNLQSAYTTDFDPRVSLGTLHLGYAIERAFGQPHINAYDLLAGPGMNTFFKGRLNGKEQCFRTVQLFRSRRTHRIQSGLASFRSRLGALRRRIG